MNPTPLGEMQLARPGEGSAPVSQRFPEIRGGTCEYCGVIDKNFPGDQQYKLCPHYSRFKDTGLRCTFCKEGADHDQVIGTSRMIVMANPYNPSELILKCGRYECEVKFEKKFNITH